MTREVQRTEHGNPPLSSHATASGRFFLHKYPTPWLCRACWLLKCQCQWQLVLAMPVLACLYAVIAQHWRLSCMQGSFHVTQLVLHGCCCACAGRAIASARRAATAAPSCCGMAAREQQQLPVQTAAAAAHTSMVPAITGTLQLAGLPGATMGAAGA